MVEWHTIFHIMEKFNFGPNFINMTRVIYKDPILLAYNNGNLSKPIYPSRGSRQGCCYSPIIFTYVVEALGVAIRQNDEIEGFQIGQSHIKSGQFADDLWATLKGKEQNINAMLKLLHKFQLYSGLRLNPEKCSVLKIGTWRNSEAKCYTLKKLFWSPGPIKILGIWIHLDTDLMYKENFCKKLNKIDGILNNWSQRGLSLIGKITVVNHLINTLFIHTLTALLVHNEDFFVQYKKKILQFLWGTGPHKIAYSQIGPTV